MAQILVITVTALNPFVWEIEYFTPVVTILTIAVQVRWWPYDVTNMWDIKLKLRDTGSSVVVNQRERGCKDHEG